MLPKYTEEIAIILFPLRDIIVEEEVITLSNKWNIIQLRRCCKNITNMTQQHFDNISRYAINNNNIELEKEVLGNHILNYVRNLNIDEWKIFYRNLTNYSNNRELAI